MIIFSVAVDKFLKDLSNRSKITKGYVSDKTIETYGRILNKLGESLGQGKPHQLDLEKISNHQIIDFLAKERDQDASDATINLYHSCLSSFYEFCEKNYKNVSNLMRFIERARNLRQEARCFTKEEIQNFLDYLSKDKKAQKRDWILFELMIRTGARVSEVCSLDLDSVKITPVFIAVRFRGKGNKIRDVEIPLVGEDVQSKVMSFKNRLENYLTNFRRKWKVKPDSSNALFLSNLGNRLTVNTLQCVFRYYLKKLNLKGYSIHSLRHYFASNLISQGVDIPTVSKILGHASPQVTMAIYAHTDQEKVKQALRLAF